MLTLTTAPETPLHRWPAGIKLAGLALAALLIMTARTPPPLALSLAVVAGVHLVWGGALARQGWRLLRPIWPFLAVLALWHGWSGAVEEGLVIALRLVLAVSIANLVTMTTRLSDMTAVVERVARPLARVGVSPGRLALAMALAVRFVPVLLDKAAALRQAWAARSPRRAGWRLVVPVALAALDDADHVAEALRARGGL